MHLISASSSRASAQSDGGLSWSNQLGKSVFLAASSVGLGWLISKLWQGVDEPRIVHTGNSGQLTIYKETQNGSHWSTVVTSYVEQGERYEQGFGSETRFQKIDITYRASVQERRSVTATSNFHVLSACSLVGGLLMGGSIQLPLMVPLLALSLSKSVEALNYGDDTPVGTIIATVSRLRPENYIRCDGAQYPIKDYPELYDALGEEYRVGGGSFRVPDCEGLFLRGTNDVSEIGMKSEDTTRMPRNNPFKTKDSGVHVHTIHSSGQHDHISDLAGEHSHAIDKAGDHTHSVSSEGEHHHTVHKSDGHRHGIHDDGFHDHDIHNAGAHIHGIDQAGEHNHESPGAFNQLLQIRHDGGETIGHVYKNVGRPNLVVSKPIMTNGQHTHVMHTDGVHTHAVSKAGRHNHNMDEGGVHIHKMSDEGKHEHTLNAADAHTHKISSEVSHSHKISPAGEHVHEIAESGSHVHEIVGGDEETRPKNMKVAYLIKAKSTAGSCQNS